MHAPFPEGKIPFSHDMVLWDNHIIINQTDFGWRPIFPMRICVRDCIGPERSELRSKVHSGGACGVARTWSEKPDGAPEMRLNRKSYCAGSPKNQLSEANHSAKEVSVSCSRSENKEIPDGRRFMIFPAKSVTIFSLVGW